MWLTPKLCFFGLCLLFWIPYESYCEKDLNTCSFYYWKVDWDSAVKTCERDDKQLLCYKSKKEIDDITEAFRLSAYGPAELELWLSNRNCSRQNELEKCLSLHIQKSSNKNAWHYFQSDCKNRFPFICCLKEGETSTQGITSTILTTSTYDDTSLTSSSSSLTTTTVSTSSLSNHCRGTKKRGIIWPDTHLGNIAILPCPGKSTGHARWSCKNVNGGKWEDSGPDLKNCRSLDIMMIKDKFNNSSVSEIMDLIGDVFEDHEKEIFGEDLTDIISMMKFLPDRLFSELDRQPSSDRWTTAKDIVEKSTSVIDRMVELHNTWQDITQKRRPKIGSDLLSTVDGFGILLADSMDDDLDEQSVIGRNMALQVMRGKYGESMELPQWSVTSHYSRRGSIVLSEGYDKSLDTHRGNISVVFTLYTNLNNVLEPKLSQKKSLMSSSLNSAILSATVTQERKTASVNSEVKIQVEHLTSNPNDTACVFWNMNKNQWDTRGCRLEGHNASYSMCVCNHLTNFAVLMDYRGSLDDVDQLPFFYITVIGCSLSIICLAICVVVFTCYSYHSKHAWGLRYVIHRNLCLTLLIANLVFILGIDRTDNQRLCAVVAGMLHYFFLAAFSWMLLEGVHIYMLLVVVFASRRSHWEKYYIFGYGFPLIIVAITAIARPMYYGNDEVCWLSTEKGTIWAFMGPVAGILAVNVAALMLAQYKASNISTKDDNAALVKRWLRITFILFPVLGITWLFGFMYVGNRFLVAGYLFAIFNSLQGVCIFVCHCVMDKKARNMVITSLKKKNASVNTGSTGLQKKQNDPAEKANSVNNGVASINDANQSHQLPKRESWRNWRKWHMPWTFCFDMPVSENSRKDVQNNGELPPKPLVLQWNNLKDRTS